MIPYPYLKVADGKANGFQVGFFIKVETGICQELKKEVSDPACILSLPQIQGYRIKRECKEFLIPPWQNIKHSYTTYVICFVCSFKPTSYIILIWFMQI